MKIIIGVLVIVIVAVVGIYLPPIHQNPVYHHFADQRTLLGVPNAVDVLSNVPFVVIGLWGLCRRRRDELAGMTTVLFGALTLMSFGSTYYHWHPCNATMFWDRLPLAVMFMAFFAIMIADRISLVAGRRWFWPLVAVGALSVVYWHFTDDLRLYGLVQFGPMLAMPLIVAVLTGKYTRDRDVWWLLAWYGLAKVFELTDARVFAWTGGMVAGHALKHLCAAVAAWWMVRLLTTAAQPELPVTAQEITG